ncbi:HesA/MoeB/ThiF family protein [Candidatus Bathyarchaeota archaeon]|nr:HesA/MoeB/ThiF family protein [Candidatus Bathyarchaeota archaeon]
MIADATFNPQLFYSRQVVLPELGSEGQERLRKAKVAVVGVGGLGSVSTLYLALAGVGYLRLIDQDTVELHNLHRQILYSIDDLRYPKVEAASRRLRQVNPAVEVEPVPENLREDNAADVIKDVDVVVDGLDNMKTRYIVNRICVEYRIPYVFGGAIGLEGNLSVFAPTETPCLECVLPNLEDEQLPTCDNRGVLGSTTGIIGALQAMEAIKLIAGIGNVLKGKLLVCDFKTMDFTKLDIFKRPECPACKGERNKKASGPERLIWLCGQKTVNINPPKPLRLELERIQRKLDGRFKIVLRSSLVLVFECHDGVEVSLFRQGRMLIKNVCDEKTAIEIYRKIMSELDLEI